MLFWLQGFLEALLGGQFPPPKTGHSPPPQKKIGSLRSHSSSSPPKYSQFPPQKKLKILQETLNLIDIFTFPSNWEG